MAIATQSDSQSRVLGVTLDIIHAGLRKLLERRNFKPHFRSGEDRLYYTHADVILLPPLSRVAEDSVVHFLTANGDPRQVSMSSRELRLLSSDVTNASKIAQLVSAMFRYFNVENIDVYTLPTPSVTTDSIAFRWTEGMLE